MNQPLRKSTIQDVAELSKVSSATVSYILNGRRNGKSRISPATRQRVLDAARQLDYSPNVAARDLRRQRTDRVAFVTSSLSPFNTLFAHRVQEAADERGYFTMTLVAGTANREHQIFNQLRRGLVDGAILVGTGFLEESHFRLLSEKGIAVVVMRNDIVPTEFDVIESNDEEACAEAADYLLAKGHRHIAVLGDMTDILIMKRIKLLLQVLHQRNIEVDHRYIRGDVPGRRVAYDVVQTLIKLDSPPTAILAATDRAAIGAILGARDAGLHVPQDLAVIGFGNIPEGEITRPSLTTIGPEMLNFSELAGLLFSRLESPEPLAGRMVMFPHQLIIRGSA